MLLLGEQDFAASGHDSLDANRLVMVTLRQATSRGAGSHDHRIENCATLLGSSLLLNEFVSPCWFD